MNNYFDNLNPIIKNYFDILSSDIPSWLIDYINLPQMQRIGKISLNCGNDYNKFFNIQNWYSNLDHSVGVALIIWHFTHNKKQTLSGLFHDIATPAFKHCIDYMNGDSEKQESTEERTLDIINSSKDLLKLLARDNIKIDEVSDYKIYPIADNNAPKMSSDRIEYSFSSGLSFIPIWSLNDIKRVYDDLTVTLNEENIQEIAFKTKSIAQDYINRISNLWYAWISDEDRTCMQFIADICASLNEKEYLKVDDLYTLSEDEIINIIKNCNDSYIKKSFNLFQNATNVYKSNNPIDNKYCIKVKSKKRYIDPLVIENNIPKRLSSISKDSNEIITKFLNSPNGDYYTYFDFDFKPYTKKLTK